MGAEFLTVDIEEDGSTVGGWVQAVVLYYIVLYYTCLYCTTYGPDWV